jgi:hypothetical protein
MRDLEPQLYPTVVREMIRRENDVTNPIKSYHQQDSL